MTIFKNNVWTQLRQVLSGRQVTPAMLAVLFALGDKKGIDEVADVLKRYAAGAGYEPTVNNTPTAPTETNHAAAEAIMGSNFLGIAQVEKAFGVKFTPAQQQKLAMIPESILKVLKACARTHILVAGFPLSINNVRANSNVVGNAEQLFCSMTGTGWYNEQPFANVNVEVRWYLLRKTPVNNSTSRWYKDQLKLLTEGEENPWARDVVFATIALFLTTGERLFETIWVRCKDTTSFRDRVCLGFSQGGLLIDDWDVEPYGSIGLASSRNS